MKLQEILDREGVIPALTGRDRRSVLAELAAAAAARAGGEIEAGTLLKRLLEREGDRSTALEKGVAIPHAKVPISHIVAVFGRADEGIDYGAPDGQPCRLFFTLAIPEGQRAAHLHLAALARIARIVRSEAFRRKLLEAPDADTLYAAIREEDDRS